MICPCLSSRSKYATCGRYPDGLMVPSLFERDNYCFGIYELCPLFNGPVIAKPCADIEIREEDAVLV